MAVNKTTGDNACKGAVRQRGVWDLVQPRLQTWLFKPFEAYLLAVVFLYYSSKYEHSDNILSVSSKSCFSIL